MKANFSRTWDWPVAVLTLALSYVSAARLSVTGWTTGLWSVEVIALLGAVLGLMLGFSQFNRAALRWLVAGYTFMILPSILSELIAEETLALGRWASWLARLGASLTTAMRGEPVTESLLFVSLMGLLFWAISLFSAYQVIRHSNAPAAILPPMIPMLIVQYYNPDKSERMWAVGLFFLLAVLLVGRLNFLENRTRWQAKRIFAGEEPLFDITRGLIITTLLVILLAWLTPTPATIIPAAARAWIQINQSLETTRHQIEDLLAALQGRARSAPGELYGNAMPLGQSAQQGDREIFRVTAPAQPETRWYWRARVYDTYQNGQWTVSDTQTLPFLPEEHAPLNVGLLPEQEVEITFTWQSNPSTLLTTPAYPIWLSRPGQIQAQTLSGETYDLFSWSAATPIRRGEQYQVRAIQFQPTIRQLRSAPQTYPDWVKERYLQLPQDLPGSIRRLSERLTQNHENAYDKTLAITNYLRTEIEYSLEIPAPPSGIDPVAWFLFTWKSGFCNYYASAQVLLLRSAGIPARLVVGYASGEYDPEGKYYRVRAKDAHAWPEVYFPGIGWVEFEPTASLAPITHPSGEEPTEGSDNDILRGPQGPARFDLEDLLLPEDREQELSNDQDALAKPRSLAFQFRWLWVIISTLTLWGAVYVTWQLERRYSLTKKIPRLIETFYIRYHLNTPHWLKNWVRWSEATLAERAFHSINQALTWLGEIPPTHATPQERAARLKELLPQATQEINLLAAIHEQTLYAPNSPTAPDLWLVAWRIRYQAVRTFIRRYFPLSGE
ncbi:MAG: hypothetical protein DDG60_03995 [Anaerolineae bacterium]|nr:MAG: hypothetical protein DDG60_03995 [Anaerolineae bacterium]